MPYGVTTSGFVPKPYTQIRSDMSDYMKGKLGNTFGSDSDQTVEGIMVAAAASEIADGWLAAQAVWASFFPSTSGGSSLDRVSQITGSVREDATQSTVTLTLTGTNGNVVAAGFTAQIPGTSIRFAATAGGTFTGTTLALPAQCTVFGPVAAPAGSLTQIFTPTAGVTAVTNALDAVEGTDEESDPHFRQRRLDELDSSGDATADAIRADVLKVAGVTECRVYNNPTGAVVDTVPANSFEVVVLGGADQDIVNAIGKSTGAGISSAGSSTGIYVDTQGNNQTVKFTRPTVVNIYVAVHRTTDASYPAGGDATIKQNIVDFWNAKPQKIATTVVDSQLYTPVFAVTGVTDVTVINIGIAPTPTTPTNITVGNRSIAAFDTSRITVAT